MSPRVVLFTRYPEPGKAKTRLIPVLDNGGYWLLGLTREVAGVFKDIDWSTDVVLAQTLARLATAGIDPVLLPDLADCDRPEDLSRWPGLFPA